MLHHKSEASLGYKETLSTNTHTFHVCQIWTLIKKETESSVVMLAFWRQSQEEHEFEGSLNYEEPLSLKREVGREQERGRETMRENFMPD